MTKECKHDFIYTQNGSFRGCKKCDFQEVVTIIYPNPSPVGQRVDVSGCKTQTETKVVMYGDTIAEKSHARDCAMQNNSFQSQGIKDKEGIYTEQQIIENAYDDTTKDKPLFRFSLADKYKLVFYGRKQKNFYPISFVEKHFVRKEKYREKEEELIQQCKQTSEFGDKLLQLQKREPHIYYELKLKKYREEIIRLKKELGLKGEK